MGVSSDIKFRSVVLIFKIIHPPMNLTSESHYHMVFVISSSMCFDKNYLNVLVNGFISM